MNKSKPIVIFTSFFGAQYVIKSGILLFEQEGKLYRFNLTTNPEDIKNYSMYSIALSKPKDVDCERLDFFCPTYDMLKRYKENQDWDAYKKDYVKLLKARKENVKDWLNLLEDGHLYLLCCWENTSKGAHCHRQLIYDAMCSSKTAKEKLIPVYKSGSKKVSENTVNIDFPIDYSFPPVYPNNVTWNHQYLVAEDPAVNTSSLNNAFVHSVLDNSVSQVIQRRNPNRRHIAPTISRPDIF